MSRLFVSVLVAAELAAAYPWVANIPGVDTSLLGRGAEQKQQKRATACPFNANHTGAAPYDAAYPYTGAQNGLAGTQVGGIRVPAEGDTAHYYTAPGPDDIRGPCPGLNTAANHNFLSHDGITTFDELVDAQQNLYNFGWDLSVFLATLGVSLDGDVITGKLSLGCDATSRTSATGDLLGDELGLDGHNKFEGDTSLTRDDYFLADGDDYSFNGTLFAMMTQTTGGLYNRDNLALYRSQRYDQSLSENADFYFGPKSLLLYGAASFLYEAFAGLANTPDVPTISSFFGAVSDGNGGYTHVPEQIPANWSNRATAYTLMDAGNEIEAQYLEYPKLFGGNVGVNNFDALGTFGIIADGKIPSSATATDFLCLLYMLGTEDVPSSLSTVLTLPLEVLEYNTGKLNPIFGNFGCPLNIANTD